MAGARVVVREVDKGWDRIRKAVRAAKDRKSYVKVGVLAKDGGAAVEGAESGFTVARLAAVHEFGATIQHPGGTPYKIGPGGQAVFVKKGTEGIAGYTKPHVIVIPERSFLRSTFADQREEYVQILKALIGELYEGKTSVRKVLSIMGMKFQSDIKAKIKRGISPANAPSTLRRKLKAGMWNTSAKKGTPTPLIDTGQNLLNRIHFKVVVVETPLEEIGSGTSAEMPTRGE